MYPNLASYMSDLEMLFIYSPIIADYFIREKKIIGNEGYIRIKAQLSNGDIFEAFEFVSLVEGKIKVLTYYNDFIFLAVEEQKLRRVLAAGLIYP